MKKTLFAMLLSGAFGHALAADCRPAETYSLASVSFPKLDIDHALPKLLASTPFTVEGSAGQKRIGADKISGAVSDVLSELGGQVGFSWQQNGCVIAVRKAAPVALPVAAAPAAVEERWVLVPGRLISVQLEEWAKKAGWEFRWRAPKSWMPPASATFSGDFLKAASDVVTALYKEGKPVRYEAWEGNTYFEVVGTEIK